MFRLLLVIILIHVDLLFLCNTYYNMFQSTETTSQGFGGKTQGEMWPVPAMALRSAFLFAIRSSSVRRNLCGRSEPGASGAWNDGRSWCNL